MTLGLKEKKCSGEKSEVIHITGDQAKDHCPAETTPVASTFHNAALPMTQIKGSRGDRYSGS